MAGPRDEDGVSDVDDRIRTALRAILVDGARATDVVPIALRGVSDNDTRRHIKDVVFGVSILRVRLAFVGGRSGPFDVDDVEALWAAFRADINDDAVAWSADAVEAIAQRRGVPPWLVQAVVAGRGVDDADAFFAAANRPGPATLRANTLRTTREQLQATLAGEGITTVVNAQTPWAVDVVGHANLFGCAAFRAGLFEVQDASSQIVVAMSGVTPGDVVVDLCAGRGGKTLGLAALLENRGRLLAHDIDARALRDLRGRLPRSGASTVEVFDDVDALAADVEGRADIVVVDAPCSSTGVLRRSPDLRFTLTPADVDAVVVVQRALLQRAAQLVRPRGRVVYATCSVLRAENDDVIATAPATLVAKEKRHLGAPFSDGDGFFVAVFQRC